MDYKFDLVEERGMKGDEITAFKFLNQTDSVPSEQFCDRCKEGLPRGYSNKLSKKLVREDV